MNLRFKPEFDIPAGVIIVADAAAALQARMAKLEEDRLELANEIEILTASAADEDRDLSDDEIKDIETKSAKLDTLDKQLNAYRLTQQARQPKPRQSKPDNSGGTLPGLPGATRVAAQPRDAKSVGRFGFTNFGEFIMTVKNAGLKDDDRKGDAITRLHNATSTYGNEGTGADGGFLVPPDFRTQIWQKVTGEDSLFARVEQFVTSGNSITFPKDEVTPWDTTNGIQAYWGGEGDVKTPSKPQFETATLRLAKLFCLVPVSDELLEDAPGLESWLRAKAPDKMQARLNTALVRGNGVGKPLGFLNHPSTIVVSKQASQDAGTLLAENILAMWSRMRAANRSRAVWIANQDIETQLMLMRFPTEDGSASNQPFPLYIPAGGFSGQPFATLFGRPIVFVEAASSAGTMGDISLVDWSQYMGLTKGREIQTDVSIHLYFDQDLTAFRFVLRVNGMPMWNNPISPENGSLTRSWATTIETRA
jgi:HK97 family phage major capsid protein